MQLFFTCNSFASQPGKELNIRISSLCSGPFILPWNRCCCQGQGACGAAQRHTAGASCCNRSFESVAAGQCLRRVQHGKLTICTSSGSRKLRGGKRGSCRAALTALRRTLAARSSIATREPQPRSACFFVKVTKTARVF